MLPGRELGLLVEGMGVLGHLFDLGELEFLLGQEIVYGLWVFRRDVVDLGKVFLLRQLSANFAVSDGIHIIHT